jgi:ATP-dependent helicase/nuclease subunit A
MKNELTPYQEDALDFSSNILLTANAGSGKTFVLSKRFVEILLNDNTELDGIVAITFTDKAAGELNKRIAAEIEARIKIETDKSKIDKLENARRQLVSANISTIHSFCINILKEFAPEAGIDVNFVPIDQNTSDELMELSVNEAVNNLISNSESSENLKYLVRLFGSKKILFNHLISALSQRKNIEQNIKSIYNNPETEIAGNFNEVFEEIFVKLFDEKITNVIDAVTEINNHVLTGPKGSEIAGEAAEHLRKLKSINTLFERLATINKIDKLIVTKSDRTIKKTKYLSKGRDLLENKIDIAEQILNEVRPFLEITEPEKSSLELAAFGKKFIAVYEYAAGLYSVKKHQKGLLDFEDILLFTQDILKLDEVQEYLRNKFKYIMIDEYQDTNEIQYKIFMPILDNLNHGNLFVVGDEKQSIYMFRDADLRVFNKTKHDIQNESGGKILELPHSFRMAPQLVLFTNCLFQKLFKEPKEVFNEVEYNKLVCAKNENEKARVEFLLADKEKEITEAQLVASKILGLISNGEIELKEIGILCRKRNLFKELEDEFVKQNIPYSIIGGKGFYQRQAIYDVYNYLSFIMNKDDDAALVGILRSPFYNLSDDILLEISVENGNSFYEKLKRHSLSNHEILNIVKLLEEHLQLSLNTEIYSLLRKVLLQTGYWSVAASKINCDQEIANLEKLIITARNFSNKGFKTLYDFTTFLRESIETMEDEGQAQVAQDDNTVKLLTIHQAKGLEYKAVFLYGCNGYAREDSVKTRGLNIDKEFGLIAKVPLNNNYFDEYVSAPIAELYNFINHKKNTAEIKRLLYVAVTRAINYLFISASHKDYKAQRDSFFQLFIEGLNLNFNDKNKAAGKVTFMKGAEENYDKYEKDVEIDINITEEITENTALPKKVIDNSVETKFLIDTINDIPKKEIISATKISMFTQCPVKYELTYDLGYSTVFKFIKKHENIYEFNDKEDDDSKSFGDVKGRIIHNILKDEFDIDDLEKIVDDNIMSEAATAGNSSSNLKTSILSDIKMFASSKIFGELKQSEKFKNELEVYCEEGEHYLFGIIDKIIYENERLVIVDYKTDDVDPAQIKYRADNYLPQLKFYAYILTKLYPKYTNYELRLIFIKHPDEFVVQRITKTELKNYGNEINDAVEQIVQRKFKPNLNHCSKCHFALEGERCVKF